MSATRPCFSPNYNLRMGLQTNSFLQKKRYWAQFNPSRHSREVKDCIIRPARPGDEPGAYQVCLKTGNHGADGEPFYREDPDALGRIYVGPYLAFEPQMSLILEDQQGICGYALGAFDSRRFYARYENEWRPKLCAQFPEPKGEANQLTRVQQVHQT